MSVMPVFILIGIIFMVTMTYFFNSSIIIADRSTSYALKPSDYIVNEPIKPLEPVEIKFDFTYVTQTTYDRICYFSHFINRWNGPFSISVSYTKRYENSTKTQIHRMMLPSRFFVHYYLQKDAKVYPINKLRNIAIQGVKTTHFWLTDMDMWPTPDLHERLCELPHSTLALEKHAIIIPAFEINIGKGACRSFQDCANKIEFHLPISKKGLNQCIQIKKCDKFRPKQYLHNYYFDEWFDLNYTPLLTPVKCFKGNRQEPYVVVQKTPQLPLFDERFTNYGYNKVQWLEHLRYIGYNYSVLTHGFAVDIPHPRSPYQVRFITELYAKKGKNITTEVLYKEFLTELKQNFTDSSVVKKC